MSEKILYIVGFGLPICCYFFWIATLSYVIYYDRHQSNKYSQVDLSYLYQVS